ncbi:MAG: hypothetical protein IPJ79_17195 [Bacteroidetes bacterium]|nr:hypothetical protein [Bacteroidota bacterium]
MLKVNLIIIFCCAIFLSNAQNSTSSSAVKWQSKKWQRQDAGELIFSGGDLKQKGSTDAADNIVRFSMFFHFQNQFHYDFTKALGFYTGIGVRNVGFIHEWKYGEEDLKMKHRSYSLGMPVALKIGNFEKGVYGALGAEAELMFAYKRKLFYDGDQSKESEWFSDKVNLFNPSVFAEIRFKRGGYIRAKYYLMEFLTDKKDKFVLPGTSQEVEFTPGDNNLFSISVGSVLRARLKKKTPATRTDV